MSNDVNDPVYLRNLLRKYVVEVNFTKKNGEERIMLCTLNMKGIPQENHPKGTGSKETSDDDDVIKVYDTEKQAWRSFRAETVNEVTVKDMINA